MAHVVHQTNLVHGTDTNCHVAQQPCIFLLGSTFHMSSVLSAHLHKNSNYRHTLTTRPDMPEESPHHVTPRTKAAQAEELQIMSIHLKSYKRNQRALGICS